MASLVAVDLMILVVYALVEGIRDNLVVQQVSNIENPMKIEGVRMNTQLALWCYSIFYSIFNFKDAKKTTDLASYKLHGK